MKLDQYGTIRVVRLRALNPFLYIESLTKYSGEHEILLLNKYLKRCDKFEADLSEIDGEHTIEYWEYGVEKEI